MRFQLRCYAEDGLSVQFVGLIMLCVSFIYYFMVANGQMLRPCIPERGLRQRDLLSSYLFIIGVKGLYALIIDRKRKGLIHGCRVARGELSVSHLLSLTITSFFRPIKEESEVVKHCLRIYEKALGQCINFQKYPITFRANTANACKIEIYSLLKVTDVKDHGLYLGLPFIIGRNKRVYFSFIKDRVGQRLQS